MTYDLLHLARSPTAFLKQSIIDAVSPINVGTNANNSEPYVSGTLNQITALGNIDITGLSLSSMVQIKLTRTDAVAGKLFATYLDPHYEIDSLGSNTEFTK